MDHPFKTADGVTVTVGMHLYADAGGEGTVSFINRQGVFHAPPYPLDLRHWYADKDKAAEAHLKECRNAKIPNCFGLYCICWGELPHWA